MIYLPHSKDILLYITMPFPPPPLPLCLPPLLHSESLIIYLFGIVLGQSIQFPLMKYPSHFEPCQKSLALLLHCPFLCFLFFFLKLDFTAGWRALSCLSASSELPSWKKRPTMSPLLSLCRQDLRKDYCLHSMSRWKEQLIFLLWTLLLENLRQEDLLRICFNTCQLYHCVP